MKTNSKIREAIYAVYDSLCEHKIIYPKERYRLIEMIDSAFAEQPVRNCEVGTPDEQAQRFFNFCTEHSSAIHGMCDYKCPCIDSGDKCHCLCKWAQMPYKEGGAK